MAERPLWPNHLLIQDNPNTCPQGRQLQNQLKQQMIKQYPKKVRGIMTEEDGNYGVVVFNLPDMMVAFIGPGFHANRAKKKLGCGLLKLKNTRFKLNYCKLRV